MKKMMLASMSGALSRAEMKKIMAGDDEEDEEVADDAPCLNSGSVCKKSSRCCSKSCGDKDVNGIRYCDGA